MATLHLIIGDIIHLIGYYPNNRPTTTSSTYRPPSHDSGNNNKPYYQYPYTQNDWSYESNHIQHGPGSSSSYPTYNTPTNSQNKPSYNYNYNGFSDDSGYSITPSPVVSNNYRPQATPARPQATNVYQQQDYPEDGYGYGSYQGIETI
jgi:hypothetical protein